MEHFIKTITKKIPNILGRPGQFMRKTLFFILFIFLFFSACSNDDKNNINNPIVKPPNNKKDTGKDVKEIPNDLGDMSDDMKKPDLQDADMGDVSGDMRAPDMNMPDMVEPKCTMAGCNAGEDCVNEVCKIVDSCAAAKDLGNLVKGMAPLMATGSFLEEGADTLSATCGSAGLERVFSFTLAEDTRVAYKASWTGQFDGVIAFRTTCADDATEGKCEDGESGEIDLAAGTHYVLLEVKFGNPGDFSLELSVKESGCTGGTRMCSGTELQVCNGTEFLSYQCGGECNNNNCDGNTCTAPIIISNQGGSFSGATTILDNSFDFASSANCTLPTTGVDVVYALGNLNAGKIIRVKTDAFSPIFILKGVNSCNDVSACVQLFQTSDEVDYVIPVGGDDEYYVVVDTQGLQPNPYSHSILISN